MKKWAWIALVMLAVGCALVGLNLKDNGLEGIVYDEDDFAVEIYEWEGDLRAISIDDSSQDIEIIPAADGKGRLEYNACEDDKYRISCVNGRLSVERDDKWSLFNIFEFGERTMRLYIPEGEYDELSIDAASSDVVIGKKLKFSKIDVELASGDVECFAGAEDIEIETASGDVSVEAITTGEIYINTASGDVNLNNVISEGRIEIDTASGSVEFRNLDAGSIKIGTASGDVEGSVTRNMVYEIDTASGDIDVPASVNGEAKCQIETASGDVHICIAND